MSPVCGEELLLGNADKYEKNGEQKEWKMGRTKDSLSLNEPDAFTAERIIRARGGDKNQLKRLKKRRKYDGRELFPERRPPIE